MCPLWLVALPAYMPVGRAGLAEVAEEARLEQIISYHPDQVAAELLLCTCLGSCCAILRCAVLCCVVLYG